MNGFQLKCVLAKVFQITNISKFMFYREKKRYNCEYIRVVNYHNTESIYANSFEKQVSEYKKRYDNVTYNEFADYLQNKEFKKNKPGLMITFDDGSRDNYSVAARILENYGFTGYFLVSSDLIDKEGYMTTSEIKDLNNRGHVIGCHTATHHRMQKTDTEADLKYEIIDSKRKLESILGHGIDIFCWCGGEEEHYTKEASDVIKSAGYKYGFMTNSFPVLHNTNPYQIQRINVEAKWPLYLMDFCLSGFMDKRLEKKRDRVNKITL